ncbi:MAG TPA: hypothetical protein VNL18_14765 [Gemmatimonadales bacterium]|nr:hypothetical protein [Gemmatimonadales bacterium]
MPRISLREALREAVADGYGDLVTRRTGQAVREVIEHTLANLSREQPAAIDFGTVGCLDLSCADEIVGRLLRDHGTARDFVLLNVSPSHRESIEFVLERHQLAVAMRDAEGTTDVVGSVSEPARRVFQFLAAGGASSTADIAAGLQLAPEAAQAALDELHRRRLVRAARAAATTAA